MKINKQNKKFLKVNIVYKVIIIIVRYKIIHNSNYSCNRKYTSQSNNNLNKNQFNKKKYYKKDFKIINN